MTDPYQMGNLVLHLHGSVLRSNLNKTSVCQAHHQIAVGTTNHAKPKGLGMASPVRAKIPRRLTLRSRAPWP